MSGRVRHISRRVYPKKVPILIGAPAELVSHRDLVTTYETNRDIKYWASWFLLKSLTTTSCISHWIYQKKYLLEWLQMNENTLRRHLSWMAQMGLATVEKSSYNIRLVGYETAAEVLNIEYEGTYNVEFSPTAHKGKQTFQYLLRTEEFQYQKSVQLETLMNKLDKNPSLKSDLHFMMVQMGCDTRRLISDPAYYADRLFRLQIKSFREGTDLLPYIMSLRADTNRGVRKVKEHHQYKGVQSVAYMKRKMASMGFVTIYKVAITSEARSRFYFPAGADTPPSRLRGSQAEGSRYVRRAKQTVWFLCDQIRRKYQADDYFFNSKSARYAA